MQRIDKNTTKTQQDLEKQRKKWETTEFSNQTICFK